MGTKLPNQCNDQNNFHTSATPPRWLTCIDRHSTPRYLAIAQGIREALRTGLLRSGERLPPQRVLAQWLQVNLGTVTRAAEELRQAGYIQGEVGRGTYLTLPPSTDAPASLWEPVQPRDFIDLSHNFPPQAPDLSGGHSHLPTLAPDDLRQRLSVQVDAGSIAHRASAAQWLGLRGLQVTPEQVLLSCGAQHGLLLALGALTRPGDLVLTEELTYYGLKSTTAMLGRSLVGVRMDAQGLLPDALDLACQRTGAKVLVCCPTLHNPTTATMDAQRRQAIAAVARKHDLRIVEDDVYGLLPTPQLPALAQLAPERTVYVSSLSKLVGPGLRLGFVAAPSGWMRPLGVALRASTLMASPLNAALAQPLLEPSRTQAVLQQLRQTTQERQALVRSHLPASAVVMHDGAFYFGLRVGTQWTAHQFAQAAQTVGVGITAYDVFEATPLTGSGLLRVCHNAAPTPELLAHALGKLRQLLDRHPD